MTSSAPGILAIARSRMVRASCSVARSATVTRRCRPLRSWVSPSGVNSSVSIPAGTTRMERRGMPRRVRSDSSSELAATTALTVRPIAGSSRIRSVPAPAGISPCRRSVTPSWSNDCTTGSCRSRAADRAARPLVQRSAWTTSGRSLAHASCSGALNAPICLTRWESSALESAGPTYSTETPGARLARSGSRWPLRRAYTVTWWPCPPGSCSSRPAGRHRPRRRWWRCRRGRGPGCCAGRPGRSS